MHTIRDIGGLLFNSDEDIASLVIETLLGIVISNLLDSIADDFLVVEVCFCRDFSENHYHSGLGGSFTGYFGKRIFGQTCIELKRQSALLHFAEKERE